MVRTIAILIGQAEGVVIRGCVQHSIAIRIHLACCIPQHSIWQNAQTGGNMMQHGSPSSGSDSSVTL